MTLRTTLALLLLATAPALAQAPGAKLPPPKAAPGPTLAAGSVLDEISQLEKDIDALIVPGGLTADQAAKMAPPVSPVVQRSVAEIEVAIAQAEATELALVPPLTVRAAATKLSHIDPVDFGGGIFIPFINHQYTAIGTLRLNVSDYILRYPKLIQAAKLAAQVTKVSKRSTEVNVGQDARDAYYEWVRAKLSVLISQRQLAQVQASLKQVRALAEVQRLSRADLMLVESQEAEAERSLIVLTHLAELREEQLRLLIGAPEGQALKLGEDIRADIPVPGEEPLDSLMNTARKQRLDFKVLNLGIQAKDKQREAEKSSAYPRLNAFASAEYTDPNQRIFPQTDEFRFTWSAGAEIVWTLSDPLIWKTTDKRLRGETNELRADLENLNRGTRVQVMAAKQAVEAAQASLDSTKKGLASAEEGYRVRRELLNAERATALELVQSETDLTRARIAALNARVDLRVALYQLAHALGNDVK